MRPAAFLAGREGVALAVTVPSARPDIPRPNLHPPGPGQSPVAPPDLTWQVGTLGQRPKAAPWQWKESPAGLFPVWAPLLPERLSLTESHGLRGTGAGRGEGPTGEGQRFPEACTAAGPVGVSVC